MNLYRDIVVAAKCHPLHCIYYACQWIFSNQCPSKLTSTIQAIVHRTKLSVHGNKEQHFWSPESETFANMHSSVRILRNTAKWKVLNKIIHKAAKRVAMYITEGSLEPEPCDSDVSRFLHRKQVFSCRLPAKLALPRAPPFTHVDCCRTMRKAMCWCPSIHRVHICHQLKKKYVSRTLLPYSTAYWKHDQIRVHQWLLNSGKTKWHANWVVSKLKQISYKDDYWCANRMVTAGPYRKCKWFFKNDW